jgi:hypothetical protein
MAATAHLTIKKNIDQNGISNVCKNHILTPVIINFADILILW